jgi:AcrR family transcriptional regulator
MPSRTRLNKDAVLQAAISILNAEGATSLTLSRLAAELHIQPPSLYNHIDGLAGLQKDLSILNARQLADALNEAAVGISGADLFMAVAQRFRNYVKQNPGLYLATLQSSGKQSEPDPELMREEERVLKIGLLVVQSIGLTGEDAIHALRAFRSVVHGFSTLEIAGGFGLPQDCDVSFRRLITGLINGIQLDAG